MFSSRPPNAAADKLRKTFIFFLLYHFATSKLFVSSSHFFKMSYISEKLPIILTLMVNKMVLVFL